MTIGPTGGVKKFLFSLFSAHFLIFHQPLHSPLHPSSSAGSGRPPSGSRDSTDQCHSTRNGGSFYSRRRSCSHLFVTVIGAASRDPQLAQQLQMVVMHLHKFLQAHLNGIPEQTYDGGHSTSPFNSVIMTRNGMQKTAINCVPNSRMSDSNF